MTGGAYLAAREGSRAAADALRQTADERATMEEQMTKAQAALQPGLPQVGGRGTSHGTPGFGGASTNVDLSRIGSLIGGHMPTRPGVSVPAPVAGSDGRSDCCCDRFQLEDGLLLDKTTGRVWEYDKPGKAFVFLPMKPAAEHEKIAGIMLEKNLSAITCKYTEEVLSTLPPRARAAQLAVFEKTYIEPLRAPKRPRKGRKNP